MPDSGFERTLSTSPSGSSDGPSFDRGLADELVQLVELCLAGDTAQELVSAGEALLASNPDEACIILAAAYANLGYSQLALLCLIRAQRLPPDHPLKYLELATRIRLSDDKSDPAAIAEAAQLFDEELPGDLLYALAARAAENGDADAATAIAYGADPRRDVRACCLNFALRVPPAIENGVPINQIVEEFRRHTKGKFLDSPSVKALLIALQLLTMAEDDQTDDSDLLALLRSDIEPACANHPESGQLLGLHMLALAYLDRHDRALALMSNLLGAGYLPDELIVEAARVLAVAGHGADVSSMLRDGWAEWSGLQPHNLSTAVQFGLAFGATGDVGLASEILQDALSLVESEPARRYLTRLREFEKVREEYRSLASSGGPDVVLFETYASPNWQLTPTHVQTRPKGRIMRTVPELRFEFRDIQNMKVEPNDDDSYFRVKLQMHDGFSADLLIPAVQLRDVIAILQVGTGKPIGEHLITITGEEQ